MIQDIPSKHLIRNETEERRHLNLMYVNVGVNTLITSSRPTRDGLAHLATSVMSGVITQHDFKGII